MSVVEGHEFTMALALAVSSQLDGAEEAEPAVLSICRGVGWSAVRARWFLWVNRDRIEALKREARTQRGERSDGS